MIQPETEWRVVVDLDSEGTRLDKFLALKLPWRSRASVRKLLEERQITIAGMPRRRSYRVKEGEEIIIPLPPPPPEADPDRLMEIPLHILHEDDSLIALNKQPGIVVHPVGRKRFNTLINALHMRYRRLDDPEKDVVPRLAHRLDRETSGVMVVAKTESARRALYFEFERKKARKEYLAIVEGHFPENIREIDLAIGQDVENEIRMKQAVRKFDGLHAITRIEIVERLGGFTLLRLKPLTGRQHQLRVHCAAVGHPIVCDSLYGIRAKLMESDVLDDAGDGMLLERQALHAHRITLRHPASGELVTYEAPLFEDMERTLEAMRKSKNIN